MNICYSWGMHSRGVISIQNYNSTSLSVLYMDDDNSISVGQLPIDSLIQLLSDDNVDKLVTVVAVDYVTS